MWDFDISVQTKSPKKLLFFEIQALTSTGDGAMLGTNFGKERGSPMKKVLFRGNFTGFYFYYVVRN